MDPGFSFPERSDLLELDLDEDKTSPLSDEKINLEDPDHPEKNSKSC